VADPPETTTSWADLDRVALSRSDLDRVALTWDNVVGLDRRVPLGGRTPARSLSAAKVRRYRLRQRLGRIVIKLDVEEGPLAEYLISTGRLTAAESMVRSRVEEACAQLLTDLAKRWQANKM
jgi:hypothetical protein